MAHVQMIGSQVAGASGDGSFAPEFRLALACARWPLRERDRDEIRGLASAESLDWAKFLRIVDRNQIDQLAYRNLTECFPKGPQAKRFEPLRKKALGFATQSLAQAAELVRITETIENAGLEVVALKGVTLSMVAFGNVAMRNPGDIDLLVSPAHVFEAERLLVQLGYARVEPKAELTPRRLKHYLKYYKHFAFYSAARGTPLELHWRLYHNSPLTELQASASDTMEVSLGTGTVHTLSRAELFLYLCVHGALHGWPILKWLADIAALLRAMDAETLTAIAKLASEEGLMAELLSALLLADRFLAVDRPIIELPQPSGPIVERIVRVAERHLTAAGYCLPIDQLPRMEMFFYDLRLRSSWRYRSQDIGRAFFFPEDWELVDLPDALFPLYALVRPVSWLYRHARLYSRRRWGVDQSSASRAA